MASARVLAGSIVFETPSLSSNRRELLSSVYTHAPEMLSVFYRAAAFGAVRTVLVVRPIKPAAFG